jgi:hypothetical protein
MLFSAFTLLIAQVKSGLQLEGQIAAATNGQALFINMGGPALKFIFPKIAFSINMVPSLKFEEDKPKPIVVPLLGVGVQFYFLKDRRFVLSLPCYYYASRNIWTMAAGIGYVLSKPK